MKFKGKMVLQETAPRNLPGAMKVDKDYFFALVIEKVGERTIKDSEDFYDILKPVFPAIYADGQKLDIEFENQTFPKEAPKKVPHVTVGYYYNFHQNGDNPGDTRTKYGDIKKGIDEDKVKKAEEYIQKPFDFDIPLENLGLVIAAMQPTEKNYVENFVTLKNTGKIKTSLVGLDRDAVLVFTPPDDIQKDLRDMAEYIFGKGVVPTASDGITPIPYHITVAQTNDFMKTLRPVIQQQTPASEASDANSSEVVNTTPAMAPTAY